MSKIKQRLNVNKREKLHDLKGYHLWRLKHIEWGEIKGGNIMKGENTKDIWNGETIIQLKDWAKLNSSLYDWERDMD